MTRRAPVLATAVATALAAGLALTPLAPTAAAAAVADSPAPWGAPGIGDPYFPLDGNGGIDVQRYDIHDRYDFHSRRLSGWTRVTLTATEDLSGFDLDFLLPVSAVRSGGADVHYERSGESRHELEIRLPLAEGEQVSLVVRYAGRPGQYSYEGESNWLADSHEVVAMNQPHMAPWWFPANDHPLDKALMDIHLTAPQGKTVVANGTRESRRVHGGLATTHWSAAEPMVPYLAYFAAGPYDVAQGTDDTGLPWYVAVSKRLGDSDRSAAMKLMKRTPEIVHWLESYVGDYPFSTTGGLVTSLHPSFALENQTRPTYEWWGGPYMLPTVVHELAHQWFGDSVAVHHWQDIWLNEGLATFFEEPLWDEHLGNETGPEWLRGEYDDREASADFWHHEVADPCPGHQDCVGWIFDGFVYQRGAMAIQALRNVIAAANGGSDDVFFALLRGWAAEREGGNGSTEQFEAYAEEQTGLDLDAFFDAWLHSTTKPADTEANGLGDLSPVLSPVLSPGLSRAAG